MKPSRSTANVKVSSFIQERPMFSKLFRLQKLLDSLFDDSGFTLGLPLGSERQAAQHAPTSANQA